MTGILDFITEQNTRSGLREFAQSQYGQSNPALAALAQADPDTFRTVLPDIIKHEQEQKAISQFYGADQAPPPSADSLSGTSALKALSQGIGTDPAPQPNALKRMAGSMAYLPTGMQTIAAQQMMFQNPGGDGAAAGGGSNLTGDEFLKTLNPNIAAQVKGIIEGRIPVTARMQSSAAFQPLMNAIMQADPNFDVSDYNARFKARADITSGQGAKNISSIGTAINTLSKLQDANDKLGDFSSLGPLNGPANYARNLYLESSSDPNLRTYTELAKTAADEVTKAVVGAGGTGGDRETRLGAFTANQTKEARKAAITAAIQELTSRIEPIANNYNNAMRTSKSGIQLISPDAQESYYKLTGEKPPITTVNALNGASSSPANPSPLAQYGQPDTAPGTVAAPQAVQSSPLAQISQQPPMQAPAVDGSPDPKVAQRKVLLMQALKKRGLVQ